LRLWLAEQGSQTSRKFLPNRSRGKRILEAPTVTPLNQCRGKDSLQNGIFLGWAMLGSNQRPLPCEGSAIVCCRFLELAKYLQISTFSP
jgi:hypothetical protein